MSFAPAAGYEIDHGEVVVVVGDDHPEAERQAESEGWLVVRFDPPGPASRGRLALIIEAAVEMALEARGSAPPGVGASGDLDASLSDQLYRTRLLGARGLALLLPDLEGIANLAGTLDAEDSAVLRWWFAAARERPVRIHVDQRNRLLGVYGPPTTLEEVLREAARGEPAAAVDVDPEVAASAAAMELSEPPPLACSAITPSPCIAVEARVSAGEDMAARDERRARSEADLVAAMEVTDEEAEDEEVEDDTVDDLETEPPAEVGDSDIDTSDVEVRDQDEPSDEPEDAVVHTVAVGRAEPTANDSQPTDDPEPAADEWTRAPELAAASFEAALESMRALESLRALEPMISGSSEPTPPPPGEHFDLDEAMREPIAPALSEDADPPDTPPEQEAGEAPGEPEAERRPEHAPLHAGAEQEWRDWARDLESATGPKPLSVVERLFVSAYVPLADAVECGLAPPDAKDVLVAWAAGFEKSYRDAFDALRARGRRPTMVLDVPEIALRIGRLHGARSVQLVLVDGMRFDLGLRMHEKLKVLVEGRAACAERLLLWSALPTTTSTQMKLLGRGPAGLREMTGAEADVPVATGDGSVKLRRVKTGHRDVLKLDLAEAAMAKPGGPLVPRLEEVAGGLAQSLAAHLERVAPRTLVVAFGDHGFRVASTPTGTAAATQGAATPEEVLVPAFAWLTGSVH